MSATSLRSSLARTSVVYVLTCAGLATAAFAAAQTGYSGKAYGTLLSVSPGSSNLNSGQTAASVMCTETVGVNHTNSVTTVNLPPILTSGVIDTSVSSAPVSGGTAATAKANVTGISLLGGMITAETVTAVSSSITGSSGFSTSSAGTVFSGAKVLGIPILLNVAPNTRIVLPGIGFVILNEQVSNVTAAGASLTVNMIHVKVSESNTLGLPVGAQLIVAHAQSQTLASQALLTGFGYGSAANAAGVVLAGRSAPITLPCSGTTNGEVLHNDIAGVTVPGVLSLGAVHTTAQGVANTAGASGEITASIAGLNLLSGLVGATTITADAHASMSGGNVTLSDTGSVFVGLAVAGHPEIGANPAPNTKVSIAGLGTLWLHRIIQTPTSIEVRMVELVVDTSNSVLPIGADVRLSVANVGIVNH